MLHIIIYGPSVIAKWTAAAKGLDFKFCPKVPKVISHESNFVNTGNDTKAFLEGIAAFKEKLGPIFLQVSESYSAGRKHNLFKYIEALPKQLQFFLEVRHPDWFADKLLQKELVDTLHSLNIGLVITDTAARRDCAHMELTIPKAFIRYVGNSLHATDYTRIDEWVQRIKSWLKNGLQEGYFFMHNTEERNSPELCDYIIEQMNRHCGTSLKRPVFINKEVAK